MDVGHVDEQTTNRIFCLFRRAGLCEVFANRSKHLADLRRDFAKWFVAATEEGESRENERRHHLVVHSQHIHKFHEDVVVEELGTEDERQNLKIEKIIFKYDENLKNLIIYSVSLEI